MYQSVTPKIRLTNYLCIPRAVLELPLNGTELLLYALLLERAKLSSRNPEWTDKEGQVFLYYPIHRLAEDLGKDPSTVKRAMNRLEEHGLVRRRRQGACRSNKLYVQVPEESVIKAPAPDFPGMKVRNPYGKPVENADLERLLEKKRQELGLTSAR